MFKDKYQKEMLAIKPKQALIDTTCEAVLADMAVREGRPNRKQLIFRATAALVTAAIFCLAVFGNTLFLPDANNEFSLKAYAIDTENAVRQIDDGMGYVTAEFWFGYIKVKDSSVLINVDVAWKVEGENIEQVEFSADSGYFTKKTGRFEFERTTGDVILSGEGVENGDAIYWGCEQPIKRGSVKPTDDGDSAEGRAHVRLTDFDMPQNVTISAKATFKNGDVKTQEIVFDMNENPGMYITSQ
jgi:hypothetical protein